MTKDLSNEKKPNVVIITGYSGAGKSVAIKALEDLSFYCIDNLPLDLVEPTVKYFLSQKNKKNVALGLDTRSDDFVSKFFEVKDLISKICTVELMFLTCDDGEIVKRFSTTRRKHPLLVKGGELLSAIRNEKKELEKIRNIATRVMDTSVWKAKNISDAMESVFSKDIRERSLSISIVSFGFKHGPLSPADNIVDVRFLKNPYYDRSLREKTGLMPEVKDYIFSDPLSLEFVQKIKDFFSFLLPNYYKEGKHYLRIGIGCTGGKHRSVAITELLSRFIKEDLEGTFEVSVVHRDIDRP